MFWDTQCLNPIKGHYHKCLSDIANFGSPPSGQSSNVSVSGNSSNMLWLSDIVDTFHRNFEVGIQEVHHMVPSFVCLTGLVWISFDKSGWVHERGYTYF